MKTLIFLTVLLVFTSDVTQAQDNNTKEETTEEKDQIHKEPEIIYQKANYIVKDYHNWTFSHNDIGVVNVKNIVSITPVKYVTFKDGDYMIEEYEVSENGIKSIKYENIVFDVCYSGHCMPVFTLDENVHSELLDFWKHYLTIEN